MAIFQVIPEGDLKLVNGDVVMIDDLSLTRQSIASRFKMFLGEWFLDTRQGVPYYENVFTKSPDMELVRSVFRGVLNACPEVLSIDRFSLSLNEQTRILSFSFACKTTTGDLVVSPTDNDFIVKLFAQ